MAQRGSLGVSMKALFLALAFFISTIAAAQQSSAVFVTESFLRNRLIEKGELVYPEFQRGPRIAGRVIFHVVVDQSGKIEKADIIDGHPLLNQSAQDYLQTLKFIPITGEKAVAMMDGIFTVWFDFVRNGPINGLDLPPIRYLGSDSFMVESRTLNLVQLIRWLESKRISKTRSVLHLLVKEIPKAEVLNLFKTTGVRDISIHFE